MDTANEELSKRLHEVLDVVGASENTRGKFREFSMFSEISLTFVYHSFLKPFKEKSSYLVGSNCEGTTTPGMHSDIDFIMCNDKIPVVENVLESKQHGDSYLILRDEDTKPGYVRLQIVKNKCPLRIGMCDILEKTCFIDRKNRLCVKHPKIYLGPTTSRNGPAITIAADRFHCQKDAVYALRCRQISGTAVSWLHRLRKYDWPSQKQLKAIGSYGCFFVGIGHPHSDNKSSEWRMSFTLQERDLMSSLNETQHKCYILLKMIKKDIIEHKAGESISSYNCKTSLFYTIESSHRDVWKEGNLILCARLCLVRILKWVKENNCPNYFTPEENLFDKLSVMTLEKVEYVLNNIIETGIKCFSSLTCDNVCELLKSKLVGDKLVCSLPNTSTTLLARLIVYENITENIYFLNELIMRFMFSHSTNTTTSYMTGLMQLLLYLQHTDHVTEHTTKDVRMALDSTIPHIQLQYQQCVYAKFLSQENLSDLRSMTITNIISDMGECDLISSKLSLASLYIQYEQYQEECRHILVSCEKELKPFVVSMCGCTERKWSVNFALARKMSLTDMSSKEYRQQCTTGCMVFHPSQVSLVHESLQFEMFCTVYTQPGSIFDMKQDYKLNWITVDSKIYLYFLQYLLYSKTKQQKEMDTVFLKLALVLDTDTNLGHSETALNLIGWMFLQEKKFREAWLFFLSSWYNRPFRNAAKWHMLLLLREIIKGS